MQYSNWSPYFTREYLDTLLSFFLLLLLSLGINTNSHKIISYKITRQRPVRLFLFQVHYNDYVPINMPEPNWRMNSGHLLFAGEWVRWRKGFGGERPRTLTGNTTTTPPLRRVRMISALTEHFVIESRNVWRQYSTR